MGFELYLDKLPPAKKKAGTAKALYRPENLQAVERDFAFLVDETIAAEQLIRAVKGADKAHITGVVLFDVYQARAWQRAKNPWP